MAQNSDKFTFLIEGMLSSKFNATLQELKGFTIKAKVDFDTSSFSKLDQLSSKAKAIEDSFSKIPTGLESKLAKVTEGIVKSLDVIQNKSALSFRELKREFEGLDGAVSKGINSFAKLKVAATSLRGEYKLQADEIRSMIKAMEDFNAVANAGSGSFNGARTRGAGAGGGVFDSVRRPNDYYNQTVNGSFNGASTRGQGASGNLFDSPVRYQGNIVRRSLGGKTGSFTSGASNLISYARIDDRDKKIQALKAKRNAAKSAVAQQTAKRQASQQIEADFYNNLKQFGIGIGDSINPFEFAEYQSRAQAAGLSSNQISYNPSDFEKFKKQVVDRERLNYATNSKAQRLALGFGKSTSIDSRRVKAAQSLATQAGITAPPVFSSPDEVSDFIDQAKEQIRLQKRAQSAPRNIYGTERQRIERADKELDKLSKDELNNPANVLRIANRFNISDVNKLNVEGAKKLLNVSRLKNPETLIQLGFASAFGGKDSIIGALLGGATKLGPGGAVIGSTIAQAFSERAIKPAEEFFKILEEGFKEAGSAFERSILGIASVNQASSSFVGPDGKPLPIGEQLSLQSQKARQIQLQARSKLLPLGIAGQTEATFVQGIVSALSQRGLEASPEQIARISELLGGAIQAQRPGLLDNTQLLLRDIQDVVGGGPQASRTILSQLIRPSLGGLQNARSTQDIVSALEKGGLGSFAEAAKNLNNPIVLFNKLSGALDLLKTKGGEKLLETLTPSLERFLKVLNTDSASGQKVEKLFENLGEAFGTITGAATDFNTILLSTASNLSDLIPIFTEITKITSRTTNNNVARLNGLEDPNSDYQRFFKENKNAFNFEGLTRLVNETLNPFAILADILGTYAELKGEETVNNPTPRQVGSLIGNALGFNGTSKQNLNAIARGSLAGLGLTEKFNEFNSDLLSSPEKEQKSIARELARITSGGIATSLSGPLKAENLIKAAGDNELPLETLFLFQKFGEAQQAGTNLKKSLNLSNTPLGDVLNEQLDVEGGQQRLENLQGQIKLAETIYSKQKDVDKGLAEHIDLLKKQSELQAAVNELNASELRTKRKLLDFDQRQFDLVNVGTQGRRSTSSAELERINIPFEDRVKDLASIDAALKKDPKNSLLLQSRSKIIAGLSPIIKERANKVLEQGDLSGLKFEQRQQELTSAGANTDLQFQEKITALKANKIAANLNQTIKDFNEVDQRIKSNKSQPGDFGLRSALAEKARTLAAEQNDANFNNRQARNKVFDDFTEKMQTSAKAFSELRKGIDEEFESRKKLIASTEAASERLNNFVSGRRERELSSLTGILGQAQSYKSLTGGIASGLPAEVVTALQNPDYAKDLQRQLLEEQINASSKEFYNLPKTEAEQEEALRNEIKSNTDSLSALTSATNALREVYAKSNESLISNNSDIKFGANVFNQDMINSYGQGLQSFNETTLPTTKDGELDFNGLAKFEYPTAGTSTSTKTINKKRTNKLSVSDMALNRTNWLNTDKDAIIGKNDFGPSKLKSVIEGKKSDTISDEETEKLLEDFATKDPEGARKVFDAGTALQAKVLSTILPGKSGSEFGSARADLLGPIAAPATDITQLNGKPRLSANLVPGVDYPFGGAASDLALSGYGSGLERNSKNPLSLAQYNKLDKTQKASLPKAQREALDRLSSVESKKAEKPSGENANELLKRMVDLLEKLVGGKSVEASMISAIKSEF